MSVPPSPHDDGVEPAPASAPTGEPLAPLWPTSPPPRGPVDTPETGPGEGTAEHARGGYLADTYPAQGFGSQPEEPPAPWVLGPGAQPYPGAPGYPTGQPYPQAPYAQAPYAQGQPYPGAYPQGQPYPGAYQQAPYPGAYPAPGAPYPGAPGDAGQPVPYGQPAYGWAAPPPPYDGLAIASMVTGLVGLLTCFGIVVGPVAIGLGVASLRRIPARGARGRGLAITGVVTGALCTVGLLLVIIGFATDPQAFLG